jgi:hypothetical protein
VRRLIVVAAVVLAAAGCTAGGSHSVPLGSHPPSTRTESVSGGRSGPGTATAPIARSASRKERTVAQLCPGAVAAAAVRRCVSASLGRFWSHRLDRTIVDHAVLGFPVRSMPHSCALAARYASYTAMTCEGVSYFGPLFLRHLHEDRPMPAFPERLAATMGHEMGHVVQYTVHETIMYRHRTNARSRTIEQQADCLAGVWAAGVHLAPGPFLRAERTMLHDVDSAEHRKDHGKIPVRVAAVRRGMSTGTAAACGLRPAERDG